MLHPKKVGAVKGTGDEEKQTNEIKTAIPLLETIDIRGKTITADALLTQCELARYLVEERGPWTAPTATRHIWVTTALNDYLNFPHVAQAFRVERITCYKTSGKQTRDVAYGSPANPRTSPVPPTSFGPENMTRLRRFAVGLIKSEGVRSVAQKMRELTLNTRLVYDLLFTVASSLRRLVFPISQDGRRSTMSHWISLPARWWPWFGASGAGKSTIMNLWPC